MGENRNDNLSHGYESRVSFVNKDIVIGLALCRCNECQESKVWVSIALQYIFMFGTRHKSIAFDLKIKNSNRSRQSDMLPNEPITCETMVGRGRSEFEIIKRILM